MTKKLKQEVLSVLNNFYTRWDNIELKSKTDVLYEMEHKYPDWEHNPEHAAKIKDALKKPTTADKFNEEQTRIFDDVFKGWTVKQISDFAKECDSVLNLHSLIRNNNNYGNPVAGYAHRKAETKMREASQKMKDKLGDSMEFQGFDKEVTLFGGKKVIYNDLRMRWHEENKK